jgi:hypothetical protein
MFVVLVFVRKGSVVMSSYFSVEVFTLEQTPLIECMFTVCITACYRRCLK